LSRWQTRPIRDLSDFLSALQSKLKHPDAGEVLAWMVDWLDYLTYFKKYYGNGETADEKARAVTHFIQHVTTLKVTPLDLLDQLVKLDTTQGKPEDELILFTTIFRTKGLEFDYVVIPNCDENLLPYLKGEQMDSYDTRNAARETSLSTALEVERRLFYVAITRARTGVLIGTSTAPSRFLEEVRLATTQTLMDMVQRIASGDAEAAWELKQAIHARATHPILLNNLLHEYLPDMEKAGQLAPGYGAIKPVSPTVGVVCERGGWAE